MVPSPTGAAPQPRADGLALAGVHAAPDGSGMRATMSFTPTTTDPLGIVALVVRLPRDSQSRILDFAPVDNEGIGSVVKRVSDDGKFAVFQGTATDLKKLQVSLAVSAPVTADIRGTCGVGPYQLQIAPGGAKLQ